MGGHPATLHREHLGRDEVHVWRVDLDDPPMSVGACDVLLGEDERARGRRFRHDRDRVRFIVRRAALRWILASYAGVDAAALRFSESARGRPLLVAAGDARDLRFSVARSEGLAIVAVTHGRALGADVERIRAVPEAVGIAEHFFAAAEAGALRAKTPNERDVAFLAHWTRVEALLKATGEGIARTRGILELAWIMSVELSRAGDVADGERRRWSARGFTLDEQYLATVVVDGSAWTLVHKHWMHEGEVA
jgi:4'-phosphopantetheinyl transferase